MSNRILKKPAAKPPASDGAEQEEALISDEPLIGGDEDVPLVKEESPIKVDTSLLSERALGTPSQDADVRQRMKHIQANKSTQSLKAADGPPLAKKPETPKPAEKAASQRAAPPAAKSPPGKPAQPVSKKLPPATKQAEDDLSDEDDLEDIDEDDELEGLDGEEDAEESEALSEKALKKKTDDDLWENPLAKKKSSEEDEDDDGEEDEDDDDDAPKSSKSTRVTRRMKSGSARRSGATTKRSSKRDDDDPKRSARKSIRGEGEGRKKGIPTKFIVLGGVAVFTILFALLGFDPLMRHLHTQKLETGATLEERKSGADALYHRYPDKLSVPLGIFAKHIAAADPMLREAAVYGMELVGKGSTGRSEVIAQFKENINGVDTAGKVLFVNALTTIAKAATDESKGAADEASIKAIAAILLPQSEPEAAAEVRPAAVDGLGLLRAPGVCKQLLKLASAEQGVLKEKARRGIAPTALPDAAGELLRKMKDPDPELAKIATDAFVRVRDAAKSEDLLPLVSDPSPEVRSKIVEALAKRTGDAKAAQGIATAMGDATPEIRIMAVKAVPTTHTVSPVAQLAALVADPVEDVRVANAEVLAKLRDDGSKKVLLEAFKNDLQGKTMEAYITALGKRSTSTVKDFNSIGMVMKLFETHPGAEASIREALVYLTLAGQGERRAQQRRAWDTAKWKGWWANINERENLRKTGTAKIKAAASQKDADRSLFKQLAEATRDGLDILEKCKEMSKSDDPEDIAELDKEIHSGTRQQEYFFKSASLNERR